MNYIYGALLLHSAGKPIDEAGLKKIIDATGESSNEAQVKALVAALDGVNIEEAMSKAAMPVAAAVPAAGGEAKAEKKEETEEDVEKKSEEAAAGLAGLFG